MHHLHHAGFQNLGASSTLLTTPVTLILLRRFKATGPGVRTAQVHGGPFQPLTSLDPSPQPNQWGPKQRSILNQPKGECSSTNNMVTQHSRSEPMTGESLSSTKPPVVPQNTMQVPPLPCLCTVTVSCLSFKTLLRYHLPCGYPCVPDPGLPLFFLFLGCQGKRKTLPQD